MKSRTLPTRVAVTSAFAALFFSGGLFAKDSGSASPKFKFDPTPPLREGALGGYSSIVEQVSPSVVSVLSSRQVPSSVGQGRYFYDPSTGRLFQAPGQRTPPKSQPQGLGSGIILTADGYIVTNRHVVNGADDVKVAIGKPSKVYNAKVVGTDEATDVAVLKIDATGLPAVKLGDSRVLKVGDFVLAVGSPFGLQQTVTSGIISALERTELGLTGQAGYENFIQTDASINPGNSGGALVDNQGRMIGINTAIFSQSGGNVGIGFAIPSNLAIGVAEQLIANGEVHRGFLGVALGDLTPELASAMKVGRTGALVHEVVGGSPAAQAGILAGDVITDYDGTAVTDSAKLRLLVAATLPGTKVEFKITRDGKTLSVPGVIGGKDQPRVAAPSRNTLQGSSDSPQGEFLAGVAIDELSTEVRSQLGVPPAVKGVIIERVAPGTPAASAGLQAGDIITEVARKPVQSVAEAVKAVEEAVASAPRSILLRILNQTGSRFVAVENS